MCVTWWASEKSLLSSLVCEVVSIFFTPLTGMFCCITALGGVGWQWHVQYVMITMTHLFTADHFNGKFLNFLHFLFHGFFLFQLLKIEILLCPFLLQNNQSLSSWQQLVCTSLASQSWDDFLFITFSISSQLIFLLLPELLPSPAVWSTCDWLHKGSLSSHAHWFASCLCLILSPSLLSILFSYHLLFAQEWHLGLPFWLVLIPPMQ